MKKTPGLFLSVILLAIFAILGIFALAGFAQSNDFVATAVAQTLGAFSSKNTPAPEITTPSAIFPVRKENATSLRETIAVLEKLLTATAGVNAISQMETMIRQTLSAVDAQAKPKNQPTAEPTSWDLPTDGCNQYRFIADVTVPDGSVYTPGQSFTKTWRIQNSGTCRWDQNYFLTFVKGAQMGPGTVYLDRTVAPGETIDISLAMRAPLAPGSYRGYFAMFAPNAERFGSSSGTEDGLWVDIRVSGGSGGPEPLACQVGEIWSERQQPDAAGSYKVTFYVTLTNTGTTTWRAGALSFYYTAQGEEFLDALTYALPKDVAPGETYVFSGITGRFNTNYMPCPSGWAFGADGKEICSFSLMFTN